jgi:outer membrane protein TolC
MLKKIVFITLFLSLKIFAQSEMTAEDAIKLGLQNNFDIQIARNNVEIAENNKGKGTAGFLPIVDASGNFQYSTSDQETNSPFSFGKSTTDGYGGQILLNWTLFDGFHMFTAKRQFNALAKLGEEQSRNLIETTVVNILRAYFNLVQQEQLQDVAQNALSVSEQRLNKEKVRREVGGSSSTDLLNAQVSFNTDRSQLLSQELNVQVALKDINILLGQQPDRKVSVQKEIPTSILRLSLQEINDLAFERNSALKVVEQNKKVSDLNVSLAKSAFSPRLFLNGTYGYSDRNTASGRFDSDISTQSTDKSVGLTLSFNLFNGFRHKIDVQNAQLEAKNQELAYQNYKNQLAGLVQETYETFQKRQELVKLEMQNTQAAEQNLQLQQDRYDIGTSSSLEFRDAQVNLTRAQTALITARFQARISFLEIEQLIGRIAIE